MKNLVVCVVSPILSACPAVVRHRFKSKAIAALAVCLSAAASLSLHAAPAEMCPPFTPTSADKMVVSLVFAESRLLSCNRDVLLARRAVEAAEADRITAGQRPNPNLTIGASNINPRAGVGAGGLQDKTIDSSLRLDQLVERGGKGALREQQADALINAAQAGLQDVIRQQRLAMRQNYFELLFQQSRITTQQEFVGFASASLVAAERKLAAGDIATNEANRFRLDNARAQNEARLAASDASKAALELAKSIGAEAATPHIQVQASSIPDSNAAKMPTDIRQRPDLVVAANRIEAAESARALAVSIATRDVTISAQFDRWPASATNTQGTGNSFGVYFSIPLSVRHANEGEVRRAATDLSIARDALIRLQAQADAESRLNLESWRTTAARAEKIEREILPLARDVSKAAEFAYSKGATSVLDLLDARRTLKQIELDTAQANADAGKAWAQWSASTEIMISTVASITDAGK